MRTIIFAHGLKVAGGRSVGINFISQLGKVRADWEYLLIVPAGRGYENLRYPEFSQVIFYKSKLGAVGRLFFDETILQTVAKKYKAELVLALGNIGLRHPPAPQAVLFHKPQWIYPLKQWKKNITISDLFNFFLKKRMKSCLRKTELVFCQTETARRRFITSFGYKGRTAICPNVVSEITKSNQDTRPPEILKKKDKIFYLFCLTRYYPHKNLELIVDTFRKYRKRLKDVRCILTIDKNDHKNAASLLKQIEREHLTDMIINVGPIRQNDLGRYYTNVDAVLLPTLLESFSGTYIEAMHFHRPILTSDLDFAREICGESALYFNPWSEESMCQAIEGLKNNPDISKMLSANCVKQLNKFPTSWEEVVKDALEELELLVQREKKTRRMI